MDALSFLGSQNTKASILSILADEWPLSTKQIHRALKSRSNKVMTYHAVYKSLNELLSAKVLEKRGSQFLISPAWVEKSSLFIEKLAGEYEKGDMTGFRRLQELEFGSLSEAWDFVISKLNTDFFGESAEAYVQLRRFFLMPISRSDIDSLKQFASKKKVTVMCYNNTVIDKIAANFISSLGAKVILGVDCAVPTNVFVNGNCVVSIYIIGERERAELSRSYYSAKSSEKSRFRTFTNMFTRKVKIRFVINRNPDVLSDVLEQTKKILPKKYKYLF